MTKMWLAIIIILRIYNFNISQKGEFADLKAERNISSENIKIIIAAFLERWSIQGILKRNA